MRVRLVAEQRCHRCGAALYLKAFVPHPTLPGSRGVGLCAGCDAGDTAAQDLLAWFAIHGEIAAASWQQVRPLIERWVAAKRTAPSGADPREFEEEIAAWQRGDYDAPAQ